MRLALGRLAKQFLVRHGHHDLGFARVGDYARERLGISTSQFYEAAEVATSLTSLPSIENALAHGALSWTKARKLARVAAPETQDAWLAVAAGCTADDLHALIAGLPRGPDPISDESSVSSTTRRDAAQPAACAIADEDDEIDGEPSATVVIRCPQAVRLLWWQVVKLSCQVAGSDLAIWQSAETIAAEGSSESGWPNASFSVPAAKRSLRPPLRDARAEPPPTPLPEASTPSARAERDHHTRIAARWGTSAEELDREMRAVIAAMQRIDADLGALLCRMADSRMHRNLGYDDLGAYCRNVLGISTRKAWALVAIERTRRRTCSRITKAYRTGMLSWHRCLVLLPVLSERTADAWIQRAQEVTARRLADEVLWARMACDAGMQAETLPPALGASLALDDAVSPLVQIRGSGLTRDAAETSSAGATGSALADVEIRFRAPESVAHLLRWAIGARRSPGEPIWFGLLRLLEHVRAFWLAAPKHRNPIFARDGWRCAVPGCSSRRNLHDHHVKFRSQGGGNERHNRVAICAAHHQHGVHRGLIRASGNAGEGLDWELGRRRLGIPLLSISGRGEIYMDGVTSSPRVRLMHFGACPRVGAGARKW
jgi:hypothetical protein